MTLLEEARGLCNKINAVAPAAMKEQLVGHPWELALLTAESYFKIQDAPVSDASQFCEMYDAGRSVLFIALYTEEPLLTVVMKLAEARRVVIPMPECSIPELWRRFGDTGVPTYYIKLYPYLEGNLGLPILPQWIIDKPDEREMQVIKDMHKHYSQNDIAVLTHRTSSMINFVLGTNSL